MVASLCGQCGEVRPLQPYWECLKYSHPCTYENLRRNLMRREGFEGAPHRVPLDAKRSPFPPREWWWTTMPPTETSDALRKAAIDPSAFASQSLPKLRATPSRRSSSRGAGSEAPSSLRRSRSAAAVALDLDPSSSASRGRRSASGRSGRGKVPAPPNYNDPAVLEAELAARFPRRISRHGFTRSADGNRYCFSTAGVFI
eukprot:TRINITY_DN18576_c0_g1_i1.p1 TRINITY_DN18576_c0_g1~~TRINITY_DN18576_c0_g1_i1.p1  ORF type:complete len:200 (+),score=30.22 TRINITY_DN18576_c0_g1_i1:92-691(+)